MSERVADSVGLDLSTMDVTCKRSSAGRLRAGAVPSCCTCAESAAPRAGSANVNMRSLAGDRDTELSVALWQPAHMMPRPVPKAARTPRGAVHCFRMSVWSEHLANGSSEEGTRAMVDPESLESVRRVWELAAVRSCAVFRKIA
jgi:hypothetical protein